MEILIADDLRESRVILKSSLQMLGYRVVDVQDGDEAFSILETSNISLLITDWMMPKLKGVDLAKKIRAANFNRYIYIIILTARTGKDVMIEALSSGADDFLEKPFHVEELKARLHTGLRVLDLEKRLADKNLRLAEANAQLARTYALIKKDLEMAAILQNDLIPKSRENINGFKFDWLFIPSSEVAGDIFNFFKTDDDHLVLYQLDVAGHGIASAMLSFTLSKVLSPLTKPGRFFMSERADQENYLRHPSIILLRLNQMFFKENDGMQFFTICFGTIHLHDGHVSISRAGHPRPVHIRKAGGLSAISSQGIPVGMIEGVTYEDEELIMEKGDRLFLYSDGIIEAFNANEEMYGADRLQHFLDENRDLPSPQILASLRSELERFTGADKFADDISVLVIEKE